MTCIIGYKDKKNNKVYIGADSCVSNGYSHHILDDNYKIFKPKNNNNILIALTGTIRAIQVLKYNMDFPSELELKVANKEFNDKYIITNIIPKLQKLCEDNKILEKDKYTYVDMAFLIAYKDKLWCIDNDFSLINYTNDYLANGCGMDYAEGSLFTTKNINNINIQDKIHMGLQAGTIATGVAPPFFIMNTENDEIIKFDD